MPKTIFPPVIELSSLNGKNGFKINGEAAYDRSGFSVSQAGDINGDGITDLIIGAYNADPGSRWDAGSSYVIFGSKQSWNSTIELSALDGNIGFKINGVAAYDYSGWVVSGAGDINGDGFDDLIIGTNVGYSYVVFGHNGAWANSLELSTLNGATGFKISGEWSSDYSGASVSSAGDINGDGVIDLIIGAYGADPSGGVDAGSSYIIFGHNQTWPSELVLSALDGTTGFRINGESAGDSSGYWVSQAGDINGDGFGDLIIGAHNADPGSKDNAGSSYVIFGHNQTWSSALELSTLNGVIGFKINGESGGDYSGISVSHIGDVNGDGYDDLIIGAYYANPDGRTQAGSSYVVFGHQGVWSNPLELSTLNGTIGFKINGELNTDYSGLPVSYAGDINRDGITDLVIGAYSANPGGKNEAGSSYVIFGHSGEWPSSLELSALDGVAGFKIYGETNSDKSGRSVSYAGDINGDGFVDLIIGAYTADPDGRNEAGSSYVIFGDAFTAELISNQLTINEGETKTITLSNLNVTDSYHHEIRFSISALEHGYFENVNDMGNPITSFTQPNIESHEIRFVHDGSEYPPAYNVTIYSERFAYSEPFPVNITFANNVNDMPELFIRRRVLKYVEGSVPQVIAPDLMLTDPDTSNLTNATVAITNNFYNERDILGFVDQNGISGDYDDTTGALTLTGSASIAHYQTALRNVTYENLAKTVTFGTRTVTFAVSAGFDNSLPVTCDIKIVKETVFPAVIELSSLDGKNGFKINGEVLGDESGWSVSDAGDINGDGFDDVIIGARSASPHEKYAAGSSYVIFGHNGTWPSALELGFLDVTMGFKVNGEISNDYSGYSVSSAGDINNDGIDDLIIGAYKANPDGEKSSAGSSYVIFGKKENWTTPLELSTLNGVNGTKINGELAGDYSGISVSYLGDVNGDNVDDLIIGARGVAPDGRSSAGASYVIFGHNEAWPSVLELSVLDGAMGVKVNGEMVGDHSGHSVSSAGDVNGDGISDFIIGAYVADPGGKDTAGASYVVFGKKGAWVTPLELSVLDGVSGFKLNGEASADYAGYSVSSGDINGDGFDDLVIGACHADPNGEEQSGASYVIFGHDGVWSNPLNLSTLDGITGFKINGEMMGDSSGISVSNAGDFNGDGIADLIIGATGTDPDGRTEAGSSYVIFGSYRSWNASMGLSSLDGKTGFKIHGETTFDYSGISVSYAGDVNGDGFDDIIIGAFSADPGGKEAAGSSYIIFGDAFTAELIVNQLAIDEGEIKNITLSDLNAIDNYHNEIQFAISALEHGYFENIDDIGTPITNFTKTAIENNQIRFVHDGSEYLPAYNVTIHSERFAHSEPFPADITFINVNDAPQLTVTLSPLNYIEDEVKVIDSDIVIADPDSTHLVNATVTITDNFYETQDVLGFVNQAGIEGNYDNTTGILTFLGSSSIENYQSVLRNVTYENLSDDPSTDIRTIAFAVHDGLASSLPATRDINVISLNDVPVIIMTSTPLNYTENDPPVVIDSNIVILDDPDHVNFVSAEVSIENSFYSGQDILGFINQNNITGLYYNETGILSLTGISTENNYQTALRNITYENLSDHPSTGTRTIKFFVNDGIEESASVTRDINIFAVNDLPFLTGSGGALSYTERDSAMIVDSNILITDSDNTDLTNATVAIASNFHAGEDVLDFISQPAINNINGAYNNITGILTLIGVSAIDNYQAVLRSVKYYNPSDHPTIDARTISFAVNDGNGNSNTLSRNINIVPENDPPVLVNNRLTIEEGQNVTLTANELSATDVDNDDADLEFTVNSVLRGQFKSKYVAQEITTFAQRNISEGDITFVHDGSHSAPAYSVRVSDGVLTNVGDFQWADIDFTAINDMPILTRNELILNQGQKKILTDSNLDATDEETPKADLIFTISNIQHGYFEDIATELAITAFVQNKIAAGDIRFIHDGSEQAPSYAVSVSDGALATIPKSVAVQFTQAQLLDDDPSLLSQIKNILILGAVSGGLGFLFLVLRIYFYRKATQNFKDLTMFDTTDGQCKDFQQRVLRPIAEAIFDRVKITGCLGYISESHMRDYLDAVMKIIVELNQKNVAVDFDNISAAGQSLLVNEIARQTRRVLVPEKTCCSCGGCARCIGKLCAAEVKPEDIEEKAALIALAVKNSLQRNQFDKFLLRQSAITPTDVNANGQGREAAIEMQTLGNVGMFSKNPIDVVVPMEMPRSMPQNFLVSAPAGNTYSQVEPIAPMISISEEESRLPITSFSRNLSSQKFMQNRMMPK